MDKIKKLSPSDIEAKNLTIIGKELKKKGIVLDPKYEHIIMKCILRSGDLDYGESLYFSPDSVERVIEAIKAGCCFIADSKTTQGGMDKERLDEFNSEVMCFIGNQDVKKEAEEKGKTREYISMRKALVLDIPVVFLVGENPSALDAIEEMRLKDGYTPYAVIATCSGFFDAEEKKERLIESGIACIVSRGRKGGSNIPACIVNSILYNIPKNSEEERR